MAAVLERPKESLSGLAVGWDEFLVLTEETDFEYVDGRIAVGELITRWHTMYVQLFSSVIWSLTDENNLGWTFGETMVMRLRLDGSESGRCPDVSYVRAEHGNRIRDTFIEGPADLAIEVVSPGSRRRDALEKRAEYEEGGVFEYWIIDPERNPAHFLRLVNGRYEEVAPDADGRVSSQAVAGLSVLPEALWKEPKPSASALVRDVEQG
ncbi:hypothetical protein BH11ARM2_BH11ARM2_04050 [soil metagenome]